MKTERPFGLRDKIGYLLGDLGNDFTFLFASNYLMIFYTKVLGLSGAVVGGLFLAARIVDAFTDVTMGQIVDRLRPGRDGRFRPWIRRMCIPVALASTLMYLYFAADWPYAVKLAYVVVTYILWGSFCYTSINIPYGSMASVISPEAGDRAALSTFRSVGASLAGLLIGVLVPQIVYTQDAAGNQVVLPVRFLWMASIFGTLAVISYLLCYGLCKERVQFDHSENVELTEEKKIKGAGFGHTFGKLLKNRALISLVAGALLLLLASLLGQTMNNYLFLDYFKNAKAISILNLVSVGAALSMAPVAAVITKKTGKKEAGAVGMLLSGLVYLLLFFLRVESIPVFLILTFLAALGPGIFNMLIWALITDVIDYHQVKYGEREDGTIYAVYSFARKLGQAFAGGLGGLSLSLIGYVSQAPMQSREVAGRIYSLATLVPAICYLLVFLVLWLWYPLGKAKVENNSKLLKERRDNKISEETVRWDKL